jgi:SAM-dependent methyltransferase
MRAKAGDFWDAQTENPVLSQEAWTSNLDVQHYVATSMDPSKPQHPLEFLRRSLAGATLRRGLSIGCGTGTLERFVLDQGLCETVDAFDGGVFSLLTARRSAKEAGLAARVRYFAADFNTIRFPPRTYDIVFFNQSLHHVANLEGLLDQVLHTLHPDGYLYLDEYVGPSRTQWSTSQLAPLRLLHQILPELWRKTPFLDRPVEVADPSEAVRSGEIRKLVSVAFDTHCIRDYGGNVLSVLYPKIRWDVAPPDFVKNLIDGERSMLASGQPAFYTVWICRPRQGRRRLMASLFYRARPIVLEVRLQLTRLTCLPGLRSPLRELAVLLQRHKEEYWPPRIETWLAAIERSRRFRDVTDLVSVLEEIRDAATGRDTGMIGGLYLAHGNERVLVAKDEELELNYRVHLLSQQVLNASERLLESLRTHVVGHFSR